MAYTFQKLDLGQCGRLAEIDASQFIRRAWREREGTRQLVELNYDQQGWPEEGYAHYAAKLQQTIRNGGSAYGAYHRDGRLVGYGTVERKLFGERWKYALLDALFITLEVRNKGIGTALFRLCADEARGWGAERLYICAGSAEDTLAFYYALGCEEAEEVNLQLQQADPRDIQLEYKL